MNHLEKPNKLRTSLIDMVETTLEIQVIPDTDYDSKIYGDEHPLDYPVGIRVAFVRHNWRTGTHIEIGSAGIWGFDGYMDRKEYLDAAKDEFHTIKTEFPDLITANESDITEERINFCSI